MPKHPIAKLMEQQRNLKWAKPGPYVTALTPQEEQKFRAWVQANHVPNEDDGAQTGYDLRGFWKALEAGDPMAKSAMNPYDKTLHYPDKWKTPYSTEGFSNQSMYALPDAPSWQGTDALGWRLTAPTGEVLHSQPGVPTPENVPPPAGPEPLEMKEMSLGDTLSSMFGRGKH